MMVVALATQRNGCGVLLCSRMVIRQGHNQLADAMKRSTADSLASDFGKPSFQLVQPRSAGGRAVKVIAGVLLEPPSDLWALMGSVVIQDDVDLWSGIDGGFDPI